MCCPCCEPDVNNLEGTFDTKYARQSAADYLRKGLPKRGRKLIAYLQTHVAEPLSVLDIGCGAGGVHQELLRRGVARRAVGVDAASASIEAARQNAAVLGLAEAADYVHADFAQRAAEFEPADIVVLDRVVCCYPYLEALLGGAAAHTRRFLALSLPIERWWMRLLFWFFNATFWFIGGGYHPYLHPHSRVRAIAAEAGLQPVHADRHLLWQILIFERAAVG